VPPDLDIDLRARVGDFALDLRLLVDRGPVAIVGPNGSGKTTLLRLLAGGLVPTEGRAMVRGRVLVDTAAGCFVPPSRRRVGYLPQGYGLFGHMSVLDNVGYGMRGRSRQDRRRRAQELLTELGVGSLGPRRPSRLSGGEQQRVSLARALGASPQLLLLDEPTAALDVAVKHQTRELLAPHLRHPDRCAVLVTHDLRDLLAWKPMIVLMVGGRVVTQGSIATLRRQPGHPFLTELLRPLQAEDQAARGASGCVLPV